MSARFTTRSNGRALGRRTTRRHNASIFHWILDPVTEIHIQMFPGADTSLCNKPVVETLRAGLGFEPPRSVASRVILTGPKKSNLVKITRSRENKSIRHWIFFGPRVYTPLRLPDSIRGNYQDWV